MRGIITAVPLIVSTAGYVPKLCTTFTEVCPVKVVSEYEFGAPAVGVE